MRAAPNPSGLGLVTSAVVSFVGWALLGYAIGVLPACAPEPAPALVYSGAR